MAELEFQAAERSDGVDQEVWGAVAATIDASSLSNEGRAALRFWAAEQMREMPGRVWRRRQDRGTELRLSFKQALAITADRIVAGEPIA